MTTIITLSDACAAELRAALAATAPPAVLVPPVVTPTPVAPPANGTGMHLDLPAQGNRDYHVGVGDGATTSAWFRMPEGRLNFGFMYHATGAVLRTFDLRVNGATVKSQLGKSVNWTIGPGKIEAPIGTVVELRVMNAINGQGTGNAGGFFQIQRGA